MNNSISLHCRTFLFLIFIICIAMRTTAQNCFVPLFNPAGIQPTQHQLDAIGSAACRLRDSLPATFQNQFKVFDCAFYLHREYTQSGFPEAFQQAIAKAEEQSPFYLIFGRQIDNDGIYTKFWVELKLPDEDIFNCIDESSTSLRNDLTSKFGFIANQKHRENDKLSNLFHLAEITSIDSLISYVSVLKKCCLTSRPGERRRSVACSICALTTDEFEYDLLNKGFIKSDEYAFIRTQVSVGISPNVIGKSNTVIEVNDDEIEIDKRISGITERFVIHNVGKSIKAYIFNYEDLCGHFEEKFQEFNSDNSDSKIFVVALPLVQGSVNLYFYSIGEIGIEEGGTKNFLKGFPNHYFHLDGTYLGEDEEGWNEIRVINKPLPISGLYKNESKKIIYASVGASNSNPLSKHISDVYAQHGDPSAMFGKIGAYYAGTFGCYTPVQIEQKKDINVNVLAWVERGKWDKIYVNKNPFDKDWYNNYCQFSNTLYHEFMHIITHKGAIECDHAEHVYFEQLKHSSFANCSDQYKISMIGSLSCYLTICWDSPSEFGGGSNNVEVLIDKLNKEIEKYKFRLFVKNQGGSAGFKIELKSTKTNSVISNYNCNDFKDY